MKRWREHADRLILTQCAVDLVAMDAGLGAVRGAAYRPSRHGPPSSSSGSAEPRMLDRT